MSKELDSQFANALGVISSKGNFSFPPLTFIFFSNSSSFFFLFFFFEMLSLCVCKMSAL